MAYSDKEWEVVKAFYERGLSLSEIASRDEVTIKDRKTISRKANQEGWVKGQKATLVDKEIKTKQAVAEIATEKATINATELEVHNTLVSERAAHIQFFNQAALQNVTSAVNKIGAQTSQAEHRMIAETIAKGKEVVLGKDPDTAIQINNQGGETRTKTLNDFYSEANS